MALLDLPVLVPGIPGDGQRAVIYYAYAEGTVEEKIAATVLSRMTAMDGMAGDDTTLLEEIAFILQCKS